MSVVIDGFSDALDDGDESNGRKYEKLLWDYARLELEHQKDPASTGLSEPKFEVNGRPFTGPWGRPQHDGPSLRALALSSFALVLLEKRNASLDEIRDILYRDELPATSVIKMDLEHTSRIWNESCFDLWEESWGRHFYTLAVHRAALTKGRELATIMGDAGAAEFYNQTASVVARTLEDFWSTERGYLMATLNSPEGSSPKVSQLDVAPILAALHTHHFGVGIGIHDVASITSGEVFATALALADQMRIDYEINKVSEDTHGEALAPAIGRYPEDTYDGYETNSRGNPWFLATNALAQLCYASASTWVKAG
ncbi:Glucoamylase, intracellular sporulation-specific, partial [Cladochytrium tenue]